MPLFAEVDRLKADLDALRPLAPEQEARVLQKFRLEWNYNSNAIEGNSLTLGETRSLLLHGLTAAGKPIRDHLDIKGHNEAIHALEDFVRAERPLTEHFIREMHQVLLGEAYEVKAQTPAGQPTSKLIQPGRYKTSPNNVLTATGEMFYFATVEETPARMTDLVAWYRQEEDSPAIHPVALAAEFHYRFVRIHPFDDGNGRMSRLLMNLILLRHGYPMTVIKNADRNQYLAALAQADANEFEPFLQFVVENVEDSLQLMIRAARGESIEEPDDLDKKLALMKKQLELPMITSSFEWNDITRSTFIDEVLQPWLFDLAGQINRFDFAFAKKMFLTQVLKTNNAQIIPPSSADHEAIGNAIEWARREFGSPILINSFYFEVWLQEFRRPPHFNVNLTVVFHFEIKTFSVIYNISHNVQTFISLEHTPSAHSLFNTGYDAVIGEPIVSGLNHQLANKVYDFIAAKLAEADLPSA